MWMQQLPYRELYEALLRYQGKHVYAEVLQPWLINNPGEAYWLRSYSAREGIPELDADGIDACRLYAAQVVHDTLLLPLQPEAAQDQWGGPSLTGAEYRAFVEALGFRIVEQPRFIPFYHEIVRVTQSPNDEEPPAILRHRWPCLMLGNLLFARAGVDLYVGRNLVDAQIATSSTLYWACRRRHRPRADRSDGWGSNSRWRAHFRRDYVVNGMYHYNVDGEFDLLSENARSNPQDAYTREQRIELLVNRSWVLTHNLVEACDEWPWDYRITQPVETCTLLKSGQAVV